MCLKHNNCVIKTLKKISFISQSHQITGDCQGFNLLLFRIITHFWAEGIGGSKEKQRTQPGSQTRGWQQGKFSFFHFIQRKY